MLSQGQGPEFGEFYPHAKNDAKMGNPASKPARGAEKVLLDALRASKDHASVGFAENTAREDDNKRQRADHTYRERQKDSLSPLKTRNGRGSFARLHDSL